MTDAEKPQRIALLIDADNAPAAKIDEVLTELSTLGVINVRRAYGNWTKGGLMGWQEVLLEYAIRPMQQFDYSKRKNATDMAMTVDAMELLYTDRPDAFGIVSSDADFTPLVMHLRSKGAAVYGFGAAQTPRPFVNACSRFLYLEALGSEAVPAGLIEADADGGPASAPAAPPPPAAAGVAPVSAGLAPAPTTAVGPPAPTGTEATEARAPGVPARPTTLRVPTPQLRQDTRLMNLLRDAAKAVAGEDGWAKVGAVGTQIANKTPFDARNYGYATLTKLLAATQDFDMRDEGTSKVSVRARRAGGKPAA